ncbi:MAG: sulfotransferase [Halioglobus sp.]|nr:sulfotransferase [Halioglobus sp.]
MSAPLILLAPPRSFTSVTSAMLGQHPQMYGLPEVHLFVADTVGELFFYYKITGPRRSHGLLRTIAEVYMKTQNKKTIDLAKAWLIKNKNMPTAEVFHKIVSKIDPKIIVEKSVTTVWKPANLQRVEKVIPNARYIHLTRHPRGQCESMMEALETESGLTPQMQDHSTTPPTTDPQILWYNINSNIVDFLKDIPKERHMRIRGEDVLQNPDKHLREMSEWLGLRTDDEAIDEMKHPERSPFSKLGPPNAPFGNDPKFIKDPALRPARAKSQSLEGSLSWRDDIPGFTDEVKAMAKSFGYE